MKRLALLLALMVPSYADGQVSFFCDMLYTNMYVGAEDEWHSIMAHCANTYVSGSVMRADCERSADNTYAMQMTQIDAAYNDCLSMSP